MQEEIIAQYICKLISEQSDHMNNVDITYTADLFLNNWLDSFSAISLIALLEEEYNFTFAPTQLQSPRMRTVEGIASIIASIITSRP